MLQFFQHYRSQIVGAVCCLAVSGCAQTQYNDANSNPADYTATRITYLAAEASPMLQQAYAGQQLMLTQSPWGSNATVDVTDRYFSAAGKQCINANVTVSERSQAVVICQYAQQRWGATRALTRVMLP